jgi:hypothetical protein
MERIHRPRLLPAEERDVVTISDDEVARMFSACEDWQELLTIAVLAYLSEGFCTAGLAGNPLVMRVRHGGALESHPGGRRFESG